MRFNRKPMCELPPGTGGGLYLCTQSILQISTSQLLIQALELSKRMCACLVWKTKMAGFPVSGWNCCVLGSNWVVWGEGEERERLLWMLVCVSCFYFFRWVIILGCGGGMLIYVVVSSFVLLLSPSAYPVGYNMLYCCPVYTSSGCQKHLK